MLIFRNYLSILSLLVLCLFVYFAKDIKLDASSDSLILKNDETFKYFNYYNDIFPSKNFLLLAIKSKISIDDNYIKNINTIKLKINKLKGVESIFSIVDAPILLLNNSKLNDLSKVEIENINNSNKNLKLILNEFANSPIFRDQIINKDKNLSSIIIYLKKNVEFENLKKKKRNSSDKKIINSYLNKKKENDIKKENLIKEIRDIIKNQNTNYTYFLGGIDMISSDTINFIKKDIKNFSIAVILFIIIILFIIYRDIKWVLIPLFSTIYSVITMCGLMGFFNWQISAISSNFISLMLILSISMNIHIINNYKINYNNNNENKLKKTLFKMFWPCLYTSLTTIVAFGSLIFSNIKPVVDFGYIMIIALLIIFITSFSILPLMIWKFPLIHNNNVKFTVVKYFYKISINNTKKIFMLNILLVFVCFYGIINLNVENSFINYFKSNTQIHKGMKLIDTELGGTTPLDIIITFKDTNIKLLNDKIQKKETEDDLIIDEDFELSEDLFISNEESENSVTWFDNEKIETIKEIHKYLEKRKEIGKVQSLYSLIDMANQINQKPLSIFELSILYKEIPEEYKESLVNPYLSTDNNMIKISSRIKDSNEIERNKLIQEVNEYLENNYLNIKNFKVNGLLVLYNNMLQSLFNSQIKSFGIILISIFFMFLILFKSIKLSILGMVPNIVAATSILGLIGLLKIPLDIMTITIAAITIGIAVDNTIHYIYRYKDHKEKYNNLEKLIEETHKSVGNAIITTSLTIAFGFSVLCLSNFIPTIFFGLFTGLAMLIAMVGVLITLPAFIYKMKI